MYSGKFAQYYDIIYGKKDYSQEVNLVQWFIDVHDKLGARPKITVVDVGCGTGTHSVILAKNTKYDITGVEPSRDMIIQAWAKLSPSATNCRFCWSYLPAARVALPSSLRPTTFDAALSMFFVLNQMETEDQLDQFGKDLFDAVNPGGLLIFDCWNYDQVLADPPKSQRLVYPVGDGWMIKDDYDTSLANGVVSMDMALEVTAPDGNVDSFRHLVQLTMWSNARLLEWLEKSGFDLVERAAAYNRFLDPETAYKNIYVARRRSH
jgi:SAM-dependent methyltransferase